MNKSVQINLINKTYAKDAIGQMVASETQNTVFATVKSASKSEFYNAGQQGIVPDNVYEIRTAEYGNQEEVMCEGVVWSVYRVFTREDGRTELYTGRKTGDANDQG